MRERVLILCRAIPEESRKYFRTVCVAGVTKSDEFRRIYPVPFKPFRPGAGIPFHKKDWVEADLYPPGDKRDQRKESRRIEMNSVQVLEKASDDDVRGVINSILSPSLANLESSGASLGFIKPRVLDYEVKIVSTDTVDEQAQIEADGSLSPRGLVRLKQESKYHFVCQDRKNCICGDSPHKMQILDWEVNELYRHVIEKDKKPAIIEQKMRQRWFDWMTKERDLYFMMGTHHRWKNWMIVSVLYLRKAGVVA